MGHFHSPIDVKDLSDDRSILVGLSEWQPSFEAGVIAFGIGIAAYFSWPTEPQLLYIIPLFLLSAVGVIFGRYRSRGILTAALMILAGFGWACVHTQLVTPNPVQSEQRLRLEGWVLDIDEGGRMRRLIIAPETVDPLPSSGFPKQVRVRVGRAYSDIMIGDAIGLDAVLSPLPGPTVPQGYDPARRAFYDGLAGSGFAISRFEPRLSVPAPLTRFRIKVAQLRVRISQHVLDAAPQETNGLQVALLTGIRHHIPEKQTESLRASGLAHVLAISGLHMGLVAFGIYLACSYLLAAIGPFARSRDVRRHAASIGILMATLYLLLSGASVATQRAYIMVCIAFLAIILQRRAISIRSVAVAAIVTLVVRPEALVSVGFQMSFAAVAAMVVIFRAWQDRWPSPRPEHFRDRIVAFYKSLFGTSFVAGFATGGFALLHFGRFARYGLLANMIAMAVFPAVMAMGVVSLLVMPFGLEAWPLWAMSELLQFMLWTADWVSHLPGAVDTVKAPPPITLALYGLGFALACLGSWRTVTSGLVLMVAGICWWMFQPTYDVRIDSKGRVSLLSEQGAYTSNLRADRFGREQFARALGDPQQEWTSYREALMPCDALGCRMELNGTVISVIEEPSEVPEACKDSQIVILTEREAGPVAKRGCQALLIDANVLRDTGGVHLRTSNPHAYAPIISSNRRRRPWG